MTILRQTGWEKVGKPESRKEVDKGVSTHRHGGDDVFLAVRFYRFTTQHTTKC